MLRLMNRVSGMCFVAMTAALAGCDSERLFQRESCARGPGLSAIPYTGASLADKQIAFTFSGGPAEKTAELSTYLAALGVPAAFFVSGENAVKRRQVLDALRSQGHLIGNYSYSDAALSDIRDPVMAVRRVDQILTPHIVGDMFLLRSPLGGDFGGVVAEALNQGGLQKYTGSIKWDIGGDFTEDVLSDVRCWTSGVSARNCAVEFLAHIRIKKKGILQIHDTFIQVLDLVREMIPTLQNEGFSMVRLDEVPDIKIALQSNGGRPGTVQGVGGCDDY